MSSKDRDSRLFKALGDPHRRRLLDLLKARGRTTGELCQALPQLDRCTVMQHLGVLERADLIIAKRRGRERWNYFNPLPIQQLHDRWIGPIAAGAVRLLDRIKRDLEPGDA